MDLELQGTPRAARIAILGSGMGSTARAVLDHVAENENAHYKVVHIMCTSKNSGMIDVAREFGVPVSILDASTPETLATDCIGVLASAQVELLVLAGFVKLLPKEVITAMDGQVINTHPALLPKFGGKGMYGLNVHRAVIAAGETESGVTVHWVTSAYDDGEILAAKTVKVDSNETPEALQQRVKQVEGSFLAECIEMVVQLTRQSESIKVDN